VIRLKRRERRGRLRARDSLVRDEESEDHREGMRAHAQEIETRQRVLKLMALIEMLQDSKTHARDNGEPEGAGGVVEVLVMLQQDLQRRRGGCGM
jgi:hypothetical protein